MKGLGKALARTPHLLTSKVGMSKKSNDPEFDDYNRRFTQIETAVEKLLKDTKLYNESVLNVFTYGHGFGEHFATLMRSNAGEYDLATKHPEAAHTIENVDAYEVAFEELRSQIAPELELIESRVVGPIKEIQGIIKVIRKTITKREHKLVDYDRHNNSLTKLRDKKEKTLNDEKNLFKLEQDFEIASNEYEYINTALKTDLPKFLVHATKFIDPLFVSFFYMQLNIFYVMLEKLSGFAEGKYDVSVTGAQIVADYEAKRSDAFARIEDLNITKRVGSTSRLLQQSRGGTVGPGMTRSLTASSASSRVPPPVSPSGSFNKKPPPPPGSAAPPPPYSDGGLGSAAPLTKKPPPPPPIKPRPKPAASFVVALYDFAAQAEGDLNFRAGDRIEVVERTDSAEDWWTGRIDGREGVFPGNYVQDT